MSSETVIPLIFYLMVFNSSSVSNDLSTVGSALSVILSSFMFFFVWVDNVVLDVPISSKPVKICLTLDVRSVHKYFWMVR